MKYFLDTNIIIYAIKGLYPEIERNFARVPHQSIAIPAAVLAEIEYGARKSKDYEKTILPYRRFTQVFDTVDFDARCADAYGRIRSELEKQGSVIGSNDLIIAATVMANDGVLVTHNVREFERVSGLALCDWTL